MAAIRFELYTDPAGEHRFRLKAANGEIVAYSEGYKNAKDAFDTVKLIQAKASIADVVAVLHDDDDLRQDC